MASKFASFFNSVNKDRRYRAEHWAEYFASFVGNGVYADPANGLMVFTDTGFTVSVNQGKGWVNGYYVRTTGGTPLTLEPAHTTLPRIDRIVVRLDLTLRDIVFAVLTGVPAALPAAPILIRTEAVYELCLAQISVPANTAVITQDRITDTRPDESICGFVANPLEHLKTAKLFAQYGAEWQNFKDLYINDEGLGAAVLKITELAEELQNMTFIKSIQRGVTSAAGTITISTVDMAKTVVYSKSKGSAGYVAARGTTSASGSVSVSSRTSGGELIFPGDGGASTRYLSSTLTGSISGGATDLTVKEFSAKLATATTLSCDGPVEWQVIEYK